MRRAHRRGVGSWNRILEAAILAIAAALCAGEARAETYYVATDGKVYGNGTKEQPWASVALALDRVGGGHTIIVRPGVYRGPIEISRQYAGTEASPTILKSEVKWQAIVVGAPVHAIANGGDCDWVVIDGFQAQGARYDGIKMSGDHNVVRNCWVHNNQAMGIAMHSRKGGIIEANLIEFNGSHIQFDHGVYADGEGLTIRSNVVRHNASFGLHLYPKIRGSLIADNVVYGQARRRGIIVACPEGGGGNRIINNTVVEDNPLAIWGGNGEVVANNILIGSGEEPFTIDAATKNVQVDYNLCLPPAKHEAAHAIAEDPRFVDAGKGILWLRAGSPAIGKGSAALASGADFWGRKRASDRPPDLGAFPFVPGLSEEEAKRRWEYGWPYFRHGEGGRIPDFWALPESAPASTSKGE